MRRANVAPPCRAPTSQLVSLQYARAKVCCPVYSPVNRSVSWLPARPGPSPLQLATWGQSSPSSSSSSSPRRGPVTSTPPGDNRLVVPTATKCTDPRTRCTLAQTENSVTVETISPGDGQNVSPRSPSQLVTRLSRKLNISILNGRSSPSPARPVSAQRETLSVPLRRHFRALRPPSRGVADLNTFSFGRTRSVYCFAVHMVSPSIQKRVEA